MFYFLFVLSCFKLLFVPLQILPIEPKNCEKLMLTHLLSHQTREQTKMCSDGAEEGVRLSGPNRKQSTDNNESSHFNSISPSPFATPNGVNVKCINSGLSFNQSHKDPVLLCSGDICSPEGVPIPRHNSFCTLFKFSKSTDQIHEKESMNANLAESIAVTENSSTCNAFLSLSIPKIECDSHLQHCNLFNDKIESTDSNFNLPHLSYIGRLKQYCFCCIL